MSLVIDMDSHLRDSYFLDEIYDLKGEFAKFKPKKLNHPDDIRETEFEHPFTGRELAVESPLPDDLARALERARG